MSSDTYHEALELLSDDTKNMHRAIVSLMEELEGIDWYQQRAEACTDAELKGVLLHNKNEEIEHAMMVLEWIRRRQPNFNENIGTYINSSGAILDVEASKGDSAGGGGGGAMGKSTSTSLGIGSLKG